MEQFAKLNTQINQNPTSNDTVKGEEDKEGKGTNPTDKVVLVIVTKFSKGFDSGNASATAKGKLSQQERKPIKIVEMRKTSKKPPPPLAAVM